MPYVNVQIIKGASRDDKERLVKSITDSLVQILNKRPEHIHIVIDEIHEDNWGFSGMLTSDYHRSKQKK